MYVVVHKKMYYIPLILTVIANVLYHIAQKNTSEKINPLFSLIITYGIALVVSVLLYIILKGEKSIDANMKELNWSSLLLGGSIVLLELGFLLSYRVGWNMGSVAMTSTILVTLALIPIGILFFKEEINAKNILGIIISILGIILINKK